MKAYCLNKISKVALNTLTAPDLVVDNIEACDSILVRSQAMHEMDLPENVLAVARAGAGVNNIPLAKYADEGIVVFNTPGANANAVKELVLCGLLLASRDIIGGNNNNNNDSNGTINNNTNKITIKKLNRFNGGKGKKKKKSLFP